MTYERDLALAIRLADAAGSAIRPYFRQRIEVEVKSDRSPVTQADRDAEQAIRRILEAERPGEGIIGEEFGTSNGDAERVWVIDPIDGTRSFIAGRPIFGTLIALLEGGRPVVGIIDQPIGRDRWAGAVGMATTLNGNPVRVRQCGAIARALVATSGPQYFSDDARARFARVAMSAAQLIYGGDCYNYALVASGHVDLVIESGLKLHDFAALAPVVEGAGGVMTDWDGRPLNQASNGSVIAAGDARLIDAARAAMA